MRKSILAIAIGVTTLTGCATNNYEQYTRTQQAIAVARAEAEIARYKALEAIANSGDTTSRVAAVIALQQGSTNTSQNQQVAAPASTGDTALRWASLLVPSLTQFYAIGKSADVSIVNSNNAKDVSISTTRGMVDMGKLIGGKEVPVIGGPDDQLLWPEPTNSQ